MTKTQILHAIYVASQTLPFFMITAIFIGLAYACGHSLSAFHADPALDLIRLTCHYIP